MPTTRSTPRSSRVFSTTRRADGPWLRGRGANTLVGLASGIGLLLLWEGVARSGLTSERFLPPPSVVAATLATMVVEQALLWHAAISTLRVWSAFVLAAAIAVPVGILMGSLRVVGAALEPIVDFIRYLPVPALVPLAVIWFGVGEGSKIFLLWMGVFFQLVLLVADDVRRVPREYHEIAATVGASRLASLRDVSLPSMLPTLVDNMRIALGWCWTYLIVAEIVAANSGLGFVIWQARRFFKTPEVMAGIVAIGIIGLVTDQAIRWAHRRWFGYLRP
jgi:NitT/TauT family transport system permease protein